MIFLESTLMALLVRTEKIEAANLNHFNRSLGDRLDSCAEVLFMVFPSSQAQVP